MPADKPVNVTPIPPSLIDRISGGFRAAFRAGSQGFQEAFFGDGWMGPNQPIGPRSESESPRTFQYTPGTNITLTPRAEYTPFQILRAVADQLDVLRIVIEDRKSILKGLKWDVGPVDPKEEGLEAQIKIAKDFLDKPDKENYFDEWLSMMLEEIFVIDALSIFKRKTRGGKLYSLEIIDGTTIKPLLDYRGRIPDAPNPGFQQILFGQANVDLTKDQLIYRPRNKRAQTPYGFPPTEYLLLTINRALRRQKFDLDYYTEGNIPEGFGVMPESFKDLKSIREFEEFFDQLYQGNRAKLRKIKFVPFGFKYEPTKDRNEGSNSSERVSTFEEMIIRTICKAFGISPQGFVKIMNRATAQVAEDDSADVGLDPDKQFIKRLLDEIIQKDLGLPALQFMWVSGKDREDAADVDRNTKYVSAGILSVDEVRTKEGLDPIGVEHFVMTASGPVFLKDLKNKNPEPAAAPDPQEDPADEKDQQKKEEEADLDLKRWQKVALKSVKAGQAVKKFESSWIDQGIQKFVKAQVEGFSPPAEFVKTVFSKAARAKLHKKSARAYEGREDALKSMFSRALEKTEESVLAYVERNAGLKKAFMDDFQFDAFDAGFRKDVEEALVGTVGLGVKDSNKTLKTKKPVPAAAVQYAKTRAAELVGIGGGEFSITDSVREKINGIVTKAINESWSMPDLEKAIEDSGAFTASRAETIARTETANAYNVGAVETYRDIGVEKVLVLDSDNDEECASANGQEWTIEQALAEPIAHPNCVRAFAPIVPEAGLAV